MKTTTKRCLWAFLISAAVFAATCSVRAFHSTVECAWAQVVAYAAITWFLLDKCDHDTKKQLWLIVSIILGRLVLDVAVRLLLPTPIDTAFEDSIDMAMPKNKGVPHHDTCHRVHHRLEFGRSPRLARLHRHPHDVAPCILFYINGHE